MQHSNAPFSCGTPTDSEFECFPWSKTCKELLTTKQIFGGRKPKEPDLFDNVYAFYAPTYESFEDMKGQ